MNNVLSTELNNPDWKGKFSTRSPNHYRDYDAEDEVSSINEKFDCVVVFDDVLENRKKVLSPFISTKDMKTLLFINYHNDLLSYLNYLEIIAILLLFWNKLRKKYKKYLII